MYIKNASALIENGQTKAEKLARRLSLDAAEAALKAVEPSRLMKSMVRLEGKEILVGRTRTDLTKFRRVLVIGGGKAALSMADALESILGDAISDGLVNVPNSQLRGKRRGRLIKLHGATHPLPSVAGQEGVLEMLELVGEPDRRTLVICLISGGGSSLLPLPGQGMQLSDKIEVTKALLRAGATIQELNVVRKHLSAIKGGRLAQTLYPSKVLSLVISDVVGDRLDSIASGLLYPDPSTFRDAELVLKKYAVWETLPARVEEMFRKGLHGDIPETPKPGSKYFARVSNVIIGSNKDACEAAARQLKLAKCRSTLLTTSYEGEAKSAGMFMGSVVQYAASRQRPRSYVAGGETTVAVKGGGRGGRNQEFALGASMKINGNQGIALVSLGTDGLDGPTNAAGALVDGSTVRRSVGLGLSLEESLLRNDSYGFFRGLRDLVITGPTGTNVNDIAIAVMV
ncbi:MAG: glycerate kinase [Thaumarchaeota archaeon]|nr:glycerate kinase [Nitrososphaerota archaeon]